MVFGSSYLIILLKQLIWETIYRTRCFIAVNMVSSKADEVLRHIEEMAEREYLPIIGFEKGQILINTIHRVKPKRILEVGALVGFSTILMGKELGSDAEVVTIEIDEDEARIAEENIRKASVKPRIRVVIGNALEVIPKLDGEFDMVFLDATKNEYLDYLRLVEDKLVKGAVVIADNAGIFAYSMRDYLDYVRKSGKYMSKFISMGWDG